MISFGSSAVVKRSMNISPAGTAREPEDGKDLDFGFQRQQAGR